jgi:hypothetical protein
VEVHHVACHGEPVCHDAPLASASSFGAASN